MISTIKNKKIDSLQALRGIAFAGIFLSHALAPFGWPEIAVSVFFSLSGFLLTIRHYYDEIKNYSAKSNIIFAWKKIKSLYPLHLITLGLSIPLRIFMTSESYFNEHSLDFILNIFLFQSWVPNRSTNVSFNGVAWFLSTILFLYFCFPYVIRIIRKIELRRLIVLFAIFLIAQVVSCFILLSNDIVLSRYEWFMYHFPVFRFVDFYFGCVLGKVFLTWNDNHIKNKTLLFSTFELLAFVMTILVYWWALSSHTSTLSKAINNSTTIYIIPGGLWVILFAYKKGVLTRILCNKIFVYLGDISGYAFLIHLLVIQYFDNICYYFHINLRERHNWVVVIICFIITVVISSAIFLIRNKKKRNG